MFYYLRREAGFYRRLVRLALPLVLQNLITTSLGFVDTFMVGLLGQDELSAVTAANTPVFLVQIIILGLISGLTVLVSQYWGKGDVEAINRCMGAALYAGLSISGAVALALLLFPNGVMALVTDNARLVELGAPYLRIVGVSYVFNAASSVYVGMQRSTEKPVMGMAIFAVSMLLNTLLNYILIFGKLGAPALGITGATSGYIGLPHRGVPHYFGVRPVQPPRAPAARRHPAARRRHLAGFRQILRSRSGERDAVGPGRQCHDRHHGPHGHQRRDAGGLCRHGQHREVRHRSLLRRGGSRLRHGGQAHRRGRG